MENQILKLVATQGIFALLFSYLLFYVLKENSKREQRYQQIIERFSDYLPTIESNINVIKEYVKPDSK
ncbi:bacteriocin [Clostridium sporogenes]|uniref:BhlA/UviB family holin-like peptide n=1 Tax=Clostridium TaxID=1485 RepID=UPI0005F8A5D9|nr:MULTISPECIES: BhlA/UviB family holin-like peptide [Clostridium]KYN75942.1 bacteriocin [Clostridium sporogenes]MBE6058247.1 bacteriocin [Clostridium sp.]MBO0525123.1 bacteriocin [Clostridium botulinum]MBO0530037.1 bacteriocin [Clostridium botulinum]MBO0532974.1 bacteriocin [Clostridium botulinum]